MQHTFKWYVHDDDLWENMDTFASYNYHLPPEVIQHIVENNPFYEVTLYGVYDDETGEISFTSAI